MTLKHLIYISSATSPCSNSDLGKILESSARHNKALGVTGMLLYASGYFMQVLEGEPDSVADIYGRIAKDARHTDLAVLSNEPIAKRSFSQWNMGYRGLTQEDASTHPSLAPFFSKGFDANVIGAAPGRALSMLRLFAMS